MLMNLDDIIKSFKKRVDRLAEDWDAINASPTHLGADEEQLKLFKMKLDMVQEQNAAIMIDLDYIKKILVVDEYSPNNPFTLLSTGADNLHVPTTPSMDIQRPPSTPQSEPTPHRRLKSISNRPSYVFHHQLVAGFSSQPQGTSGNVMGDLPIATNLESELRELKKPLIMIPPAAASVPMEQQTSEELTHDMEMTIPSYDDLHRRDRPISPKDTSRQVLIGEPGGEEHVRNYPATESLDVEQYDLRIIDNPRTVAEVYHEYANSLKAQIEEFERLFGKGQLSKLPKIRTYQRRRALVTEIDKYATTYNKSIHEAIEFFERVRKSKKRTVPGLYNNLHKILKDLERSDFND